MDGLVFLSSRYQVIGSNHVAVPTHFFKVVVGEMATSGDLEMEAFVLPNEAIPDSTPLSSFQVIILNFAFIHRAS